MKTFELYRKIIVRGRFIVQERAQLIFTFQCETWQEANVIARAHGGYIELVMA